MPNDLYKKADEKTEFRPLLDSPADPDPQRTLGIPDRDVEKARQVARAAGAYRKTEKRSTRR
jgi:hypothetical protein